MIIPLSISVALVILVLVCYRFSPLRSEPPTVKTPFDFHTEYPLSALKRTSSPTKGPPLEGEVNQACDFLNLLAEEVYGVAKRSGFHDKPVDLAVMLQNLAGEQAELWESFRKQTLNDLCDKADKMKEAGLEPLTSIEEEMADIVIRALDTAVEHRVDIGRAVRLKNAFNKTRPFRHGNKRA